MARVTCLLVYVSAGPRSFAVIEEINRYLASEYPHSAAASALVSLRDRRLPDNWWGGTKEIPLSLYVGGYNYLDLAGFLRYVRGLDWRPGETCQAMVREQDDVFRLYDVVGPNAASNLEDSDGGSVPDRTIRDSGA